MVTKWLLERLKLKDDVEVIENIDIQLLDAEHVLPDMGLGLANAPALYAISNIHLIEAYSNVRNI